MNTKIFFGKFFGCFYNTDNFMFPYLPFVRNYCNFKKKLIYFLAILNTFCRFFIFWAWFMKNLHCMWTCKGPFINYVSGGRVKNFGGKCKRLETHARGSALRAGTREGAISFDNNARICTLNLILKRELTTASLLSVRKIHHL